VRGGLNNFIENNLGYIHAEGDSCSSERRVKYIVKDILK
jgi:hypothetical protein